MQWRVCRQRTDGKAWARLKLQTQQSNNSPYLTRWQWTPRHFSNSCGCRWLSLVVTVVLGYDGVLFLWGASPKCVAGTVLPTYVLRLAQHRHFFCRIDIFHESVFFDDIWSWMSRHFFSFFWVKTPRHVATCHTTLPAKEKGFRAL